MRNESAARCERINDDLTTERRCRDKTAGLTNADVAAEREQLGPFGAYVTLMSPPIRRSRFGSPV
ncbi:MAG: hypothetical protein M3Q09_09335, partial [Gemmatimonadota bacterium]|nr:hypothetical protein [Gemmatimonadota bacterium]